MEQYGSSFEAKKEGEKCRRLGESANVREALDRKFGRVGACGWVYNARSAILPEGEIVPFHRVEVTGCTFRIQRGRDRGQIRQKYFWKLVRDGFPPFLRSERKGVRSESALLASAVSVARGRASNEQEGQNEARQRQRQRQRPAERTPRHFQTSRDVSGSDASDGRGGLVRWRGGRASRGPDIYIDARKTPRRRHFLASPKVELCSRCAFVVCVYFSPEIGHITYVHFVKLILLIKI